MTSVLNLSNPTVDAIDQAQSMVVALNNRGVMLLSRQEYANAHACFLDAVRILQTISLTLDTPSLDHENKLCELMTRTQLCTSHDMTQTDKMKIADEPASTGTKEQLRVISTQTETASVLSSMIVWNGQHTPNPPAILPILIVGWNDDHGVSEGEGSNDVRGVMRQVLLQSCILLRNLGLSKAHWANSKTVESSSHNQESFWKKAYHLFTLSSTLLNQLCDDDTTIESSPEFRETLLLLELLLAYDLLGTSIRIDLEFHIILQHDEKLQSLSHWIHQREQWIQSGIIAAAAA
jgi:hypothetical protein